jgi:hypothetical protein
VANTLTNTSTPSSIFDRKQYFASLGKKLLAIALSYEVCTYALATVQAVGLTLPTMVNGGPVVGKTQCSANMHQILDAAMQWKAVHPGMQIHRPRLSELKPFINEIPQCPDGGTYEMVFAGHTLKVQDGTTAVVPDDRVGVRCVHEGEVDTYHGGKMSNPFSN